MDDGVFYLLRDHLNSSSVILNQSGAVVTNGNQYYTPYGGNRGGTPFSPVTTKRFTGQYHENGLTQSEGLSYYGARWYDAKLGRFLSADTVVPGPTNPQAFNRYSYVLNNPLKYIDPTGHGHMCTADPYDPGCAGDQGGSQSARPSPTVLSQYPSVAFPRKPRPVLNSGSNSWGAWIYDKSTAIIPDVFFWGNEEEFDFLSGIGRGSYEYWDLQNNTRVRITATYGGFTGLGYGGQAVGGSGYYTSHNSGRATDPQSVLAGRSVEFGGGGSSGFFTASFSVGNNVNYASRGEALWYAKIGEGVGYGNTPGHITWSEATVVDFQQFRSNQEMAMAYLQQYYIPTPRYPFGYLAPIPYSNTQTLALYTMMLIR